MPEETEAPTEEQPVEEQVEEQEVDDAIDDEDDAPENQDSVEYWKNKAKKNGNEAKNLRTRLRDTESELTPLREARLKAERDGMSELDRFKAENADLKAAVEKLTREVWDRDVDARWDLPARAKSFLSGATAEEYMAAADEIAKDLGLERKDKSPRRTKAPAGDLGGGRDAGKEPAPSIDAQILEAQNKGDWHLVARLNTIKLATAGK